MFPGLLFIVFRFFAASLGSNKRGSTRWNLCRPRCPQLIQKGRQSNSWRVYQARRPCWYLAMRSRFLSNVGGVFISCRGWVHQIGIEVVQILGKVVGSENSGAPRHDGPVQQHQVSGNVFGVASWLGLWTCCTPRVWSTLTLWYPMWAISNK